MSKDSNVTTLDDEVQVAEPVKATRTKAKTAEVADGEFYNITFYPTGDEAGSQLVDVSVNGYLIRFERGVPHKVSKSFKEGIEQMVVTTFHKVNGEDVEKHTPRFPFSAVPA
jgi:hypothetical protein